MSNNNEAVKVFVAKVQERMDNYYRTQYPNAEVPKLELNEAGLVNYKIIETMNGRARSVVAFVRKDTGEIFKPAGWSKPAKHARGNINSDQNGMEAVSASGTHIIYLRG